MKTRLNVVLVVAGMLAAGSVLADGIKSRSSEDAYNDMMRNWGSAPSAEPSKQVMSRSVESARADMMRDWDAKMTGEPAKEAQTVSDHSRYVELMRGTFPLVRIEDQ